MLDERRIEGMWKASIILNPVSWLIFNILNKKVSE